MLTIALPLRELGIIAVTRGMLGAGLGLLVSDHLSRHRRRTAGRILLAIGAVSTIPLIIDVMRRRQRTV